MRNSPNDAVMLAVVWVALVMLVFWSFLEAIQ